MAKKTIEERIEEYGESCKAQLREKATAVMTIEGSNAITLERFEKLMNEANEDTKEITTNIFNDIMSNNLQDELLRKKN